MTTEIPTTTESPKIRMIGSINWDGVRKHHRKDTVQAKAEYARKTKQLQKALTELSPVDFASMLTYVYLPFKDFKTILAWGDAAWSNYGSLKEYEYYENREDEDKSKDENNKEFELLTEDLFKKINKNNKLPYSLYYEMRCAECNQQFAEEIGA